MNFIHKRLHILLILFINVIEYCYLKILYKYRIIKLYIVSYKRQKFALFRINVVQILLRSSKCL